ncbi:MAG: DUF6279 family lipoprotein [Chromatocurvus sp.]
MLRPCRGIVCCLLLALVAGCSGTQFFYNRLDFLIPWYLSGYVDLDRSQREFLEDRVDAFLGWHRRSELPRYAVLLARAEQALDSRVTADTVKSLALAAETEWYRMRDRALDELIAVGDGLDERQVAGFIGTLRERQAEYEEEYLERDDEEYREEACDRLVDNLEDYLGRLRRESQRETCAMLEDLRRSDTVWLAERERWLDWLERVLQRRPGWQAELRGRVTDWESTVSPEYLSIYDHNTALIYHAVASAVEARSERQDRHLRRKLAGLREDVNELSAP